MKQKLTIRMNDAAQAKQIKYKILSMETKTSQEPQQSFKKNIHTNSPVLQMKSIQSYVEEWHICFLCFVCYSIACFAAAKPDRC